MIKWLFPKIVGGKNERELSRIRPVVARINEIEDALQREPAEKLRQLAAGWQRDLARYRPLDLPPSSALDRMDGDALRTIAAALEDRLAALRGEFPSLPRQVAATAGAIVAAAAEFHRVEVQFAKSRAGYLDRILPDAYAVVKNAARRLCGRDIAVGGVPQRWEMVHFDVQLTGGVALHRGTIAEMQTGEGKTLVATLPVFLHALTGLGVHVVTVNDYLAQRDAEWMGALFRSLGLTVGCIRSQMPPHERREAYACDITYGTSSEFGFDYLRDNGIASGKHEQVQRGRYLAIIDEVDCILIDDARTPLIISGDAPLATDSLAVHRPRVEQLAKRQTELCNRLAVEAERQLAAGDTAAAGLTLLKLKLGQPRNRRFLRFMEDHSLRRLLEKAELAHQRGAFQKDILLLKEQLYFVVDEKNKDADLTDKGRRFLAPDDPDFFTLPDLAPVLAAIDDGHELAPELKAAARREARAGLEARAETIHCVSRLLKAWCLYERDVDYVVRDGKVIIIDESTGREMDGRRWADGLHQAVEAKERTAVGTETRTYATITLQNYFRLYERLAGMTGTAETAAAEFHDIYGLDVLPIPTNAPNIRIDDNDLVFKTRREKLQAVVAKIQRIHATGQPVLVGTASVEASEILARMLKRAAIPHTVLNAKFHEREAAIVARAGERGEVTVATNMAGRGTDIKLAPGVAELGGLFVLGTERHSSRRIDRQLRGRCARQGDPGRSQFFISLEDDLMRHHAAQGMMAGLIQRHDDGDSPGPAAVGKLVQAAQKQVEQRDYRARKQMLDFDDVMNLQREIVYGYRNEALAAGSARDLVQGLIEQTVSDAALRHFAEPDAGSNDPVPLLRWVDSAFAIRIEPEDMAGFPAEEIATRIAHRIHGAYRRIVDGLPADSLDRHERRVVLAAIDRGWQGHLERMEELRDGVFLRSQAERNPLVEYKNAAYRLFATLMDDIRQDALRMLFRSVSDIAWPRVAQPAPPLGPGKPPGWLTGMGQVRAAAASAGRNGPCPCGSGKKRKRCCGRVA